jgi:photosystem II stability/assembly factor-like uncharacterized protein
MTVRPGGAQDVKVPAPFYGARMLSLAWRAKWFQLSRSADERALTKARDLAYEQKLQTIKMVGDKSGAIAGYDPAGAGSPWYSLGPRNVNGRVKALVCHPTDPNTVYAGAASGGVWKSTDGGQTWDPLWDMQTSIAIGALGIAQSSPNTIYAGTGEWTPGYGGSYGGAGVYVSIDGGTNWSPRPNVTSRRIGKLVVDPTNSLRLWVCGDQGLERSIDGGANWATLRTGQITDIALDPTNSDVVYIAVRYDGFYKSIDGGTNFNLLPGAPTGVGVEWPQIAIGVSGPHANNFIVIKMGGTVQSSIDGGTTFNAVPGTHGGSWVGWCDVIACAPDDEQIIFWGGVGLDRTSNGGTNWTSLPVHSDQHAVVFAPSNTNVVYAANDGGVWRSDDKGATIRKVSNGLVITQFYNVNIWRTLSNVLGGGAQDNGVNYTGGGLTWQPVYGNDGGWFVIDPTDPRTIYAESQYANVVKSTDGGQTWVSKTAGIVGTSPWEGVLTMDPNDHLRLFYGTDRVLRSTDGLATPWTQSSQVLTGEVSAIAVAQVNSNRVYAGTGSGRLYRSDDGGNTSPWADKTGVLPGRVITSIAVDSANADIVLVSIGGLSGTMSSKSVYRSIDGGSSWNDVSGDLPNVVGNAVVIDPSAGNTWYLATDTGVYRTQNGGTNWVPFDNGIPNVPVSDLVVDPASKILYSATFGRGAFKLDITPGVNKAPVDLYVRDDDLDTGERFPSPSGLPDPFLPAPDIAYSYMSPDIKINHQPPFTPSAIFDGVDFDTSLQHQDPVRGQSNRFFVQVTNRGWQATNNVAVRAFVADATGGLPSLPNALVPPNFDLVNMTVWQPVGPAQTIPVLKPNRPVIVYWDFALPVTAATHTCCLAVISSADDPFNNANVDTWQLVTMDKRVCLKNLHVVDPGMGPMPMTMTAMNFHNPTDKEAVVDIVIQPSRFARGTIGLLLPRIEIDPRSNLHSVEAISLAPDDPLGQWYTSSKNALSQLKERLSTCDRSRIFDFDRTKQSEIRGIRLGPRKTLQGIFLTSLRNDAAQTGLSRFNVVQRCNGKVVGGSTFQFGYDLPVRSLTRPIVPIRIRIVAAELKLPEEVADRSRGMMIAQVTVDDENRIYQRLLPDVSKSRLRSLFDGFVLEGEKLTLSLINGEESLERGEYLYQHRFEGPVASWFGEHRNQKGERFRFVYRIEAVLPANVPLAD